MSARTPGDICPRKLPSDGKGMTKRMKMHLNFGGDGGVGLYIVSYRGRETPINYQYDTRKDGLNGFWLNDVKEPDGAPRMFKWKDLCAFWPEYLKSRKTKSRAEKEGA